MESRWWWPRNYFRHMVKWGWAGTCYPDSPEADSEWQCSDEDYS